MNDIEQQRERWRTKAREVAKNVVAPRAAEIDAEGEFCLAHWGVQLYLAWLEFKADTGRIKAGAAPFTHRLPAVGRRMPWGHWKSDQTGGATASLDHLDLGRSDARHLTFRHDDLWQLDLCGSPPPMDHGTVEWCLAAEFAGEPIFVGAV